MAKKKNLQGERLHHFELSDKSRTVRWIIITVLLVVGIGAIMWALTAALTTPAGWKSIEAPSGTLNCGHEFGLQYDLGAGERSATTEKKELTTLYGQLTEKAWYLFYCEAVENEVAGLRYLNSHPNEEVTVDAALYRALTQVTSGGNRTIYFGPVYHAYDQVFQSLDLAVAQQNDPTTVPELQEYVQSLADYANDPRNINLELRGENRVYLSVGSEYLQFLQENEVARFLDFGWLRNAFVIDYFAEQLINAGFTNGYFYSVDGYIRNLDQRATQYAMNVIMDKQVAATMEYPGGTSIVSFRNYPLYEENSDRYYTFPDGRTVTAMIDLTDGQSKCAVSDLIGYGKDKGCAELAMAIMPVYAADVLSEDGLNGLTQQGIYSIWCAGKELRYNQPDFSFTAIDEAYRAIPVIYE